MPQLLLSRTGIPSPAEQIAPSGQNLHLQKQAPNSARPALSALLTWTDELNLKIPRSSTVHPRHSRTKTWKYTGNLFNCILSKINWECEDQRMCFLTHIPFLIWFCYIYAYDIQRGSEKQHFKTSPQNFPTFCLCIIFHILQRKKKYNPCIYEMATEYLTAKHLSVSA